MQPLFADFSREKAISSLNPKIFSHRITYCAVSRMKPGLKRGFFSLLLAFLWLRSESPAAIYAKNVYFMHFRHVSVPSAKNTVRREGFVRIKRFFSAGYSSTAACGIDFTYDDESFNDYNSVVSSNGEAARAPVLTIEYKKELRIGYTIQNNYQSPCGMSTKNHPGFVNYAEGVKNTLGREKTYFSYEGSVSYSNDLKSDVLTGGISYPNIEDVDLMFYIGHGYKKGDLHVGCGIPGYNSLHFGTTNSTEGHTSWDGNNPDANFTTYDARYFGYNSRVKWLVAYSCNFLETNDPAVMNMLSNGGRLILGFSSKMVVNSLEGELFAQQCLDGHTIQEAFFKAAGKYQDSTVFHGRKYVSCLCYYDDNHPAGTKSDTLTYQDTSIIRDKYYCTIYDVDDLKEDEETDN